MFMTQSIIGYSSVPGVAQKRRMPQPGLGLAVAAPYTRGADSVHFGFKKTADGSTVPYQDAALSALDSYDFRTYQPKKLAAITVTIHGQQEKYFIYSQNLAGLMGDDKNDVHEIYQEKNPHVSGIILKRKTGGDWHTLQIREPHDPIVKRPTADNGAETDSEPKMLTLKLAKQ